MEDYIETLKNCKFVLKKLYYFVALRISFKKTYIPTHGTVAQSLLLF